jgi:anti-anti-sigma factor
MSTGFRAARDGNRVVLFLPPMFTATSLGAWDTLISTLVRHGYTDLVADCSGNAYCDSAGIGELVRAYSVCGRAGGSFALNQCSDRVRDLLDVTRLGPLFELTAVDYSALPTVDLSPDRVSSLAEGDGR